MSVPSLQPLRFAGYAGLFDIPDAARDTIRQGAFVASLAGRSKPLPLLWQHRSEQQIGGVEMAAEDNKGLRVIGRIDQVNSRAAEMLKAGKVTGLSFGYRARETQHNENGRELFGIDLFEVSLVTHPLQYGARVHLIA